MPHDIVDSSGDGLMTTGELSGCCFHWQVNGAHLWCTPVQTVGGIAKNDLHMRLSIRGVFATHRGAGLRTFGFMQYPFGRATVVGVRRHGNRNLFAQISNDSLRKIDGALHQHPGGPRRL